MRRTTKISACSLAILVAASTKAAHATTKYWVGDVSGYWDADSSGSTNWSNAIDSTSDSAVPTMGDDLVFSNTVSAGNLSTTISALTTTFNLTIHSINVLSTNTSAMSIGGNANTALHLTDGGLTVQSGAGQLSIAAKQTLGASQTWTNNSTNTLLLTGAVTGTSAQTVTIAGTGTISSSSMLGNFNVAVQSGATYKIAGGSAVNIALNGGTVDGNGGGLVIEYLSGSGGTFTNMGASGGNLNLAFAPGISSAEYDGSIGSAVSNFAVRGDNGNGTEILTGQSSYTGGTSIGNSTNSNGKTVALQLDGGDNRLPVGTTVSFGLTNPGLVTTEKLILGGALSASSQTVAGILVASGANNVASIVGGNSNVSTLTVNSFASDRTFSGTIGGPGTNENNVALAKIGGHNLVLTAANTYTGGTSVGAGVLQLSGSGTLGDVAGSLTMGGGTLDLNGTNQGVGLLNGNAGTILNNSTGTSVTLTIGNGNATGGSFSGVIADHSSGTGTVSVTKTGSGTLTLAGTETFTGGTSVSAGTLETGTPLGTGDVAVADGATLQLDVRSSINDSATLTLYGGTSHLNLDYVAGNELVNVLVINGTTFNTPITFGPGNYHGFDSYFTSSGGGLQVVPEPGVLSMMGLLASGLVMRRRRRAR